MPPNQPQNVMREIEKIIRESPTRIYSTAKNSTPRLISQPVPECLSPGDSQTISVHKKALSIEQCKRLFGERDAVKMNFIPQMLISVALRVAEDLLAYCRNNRIDDVKKHSRLMRTAIGNYKCGLPLAYGPAIHSYKRYVRLFTDMTDMHVTKMKWNAEALARDKLRDHDYTPIAAYALIISMLIHFVQNFDSKMDKMIEDRLHTPVRHRKDPNLLLMLAVCASYADDLGYRIEPDKNTSLSVTILSHNAYRLADHIIEEEKSLAENEIDDELDDE